MVKGVLIMNLITMVTFIAVSGFVSSSILGTIRELIVGQQAGFRNGYIQSVHFISAFFTVLCAGPFMAWRDMEKWCRETQPNIGQVLTIVAFIGTWSLLIGLFLVDFLLSINL